MTNTTQDTTQDQPTVTERQAVERERAAYIEGQCRANIWLNANGLREAASAHAGGPFWTDLAAKRYPLPKVRRLREVYIGFLPYRFNPATSVFETSFRSGHWESSGNFDGGSPARWLIANIGTLADLKANPWEEVDA